MTKAKKRKLNTLEIIIIIVAATLTVLLFVPTINPARVTILINKTMSFFTSAVSYSRLTSEAIRAMRNSWVSKGDFVILYISSLVSVLGILTTVVGASFLIGNNKFKNLSNRLTLLGSGVAILGLSGIFIAYNGISKTNHPVRVEPSLPSSIYFFLAFGVICLILSIVLLIITPKAAKEEGYEMERPYQLLLMYLPFAALIFVFSYLPLWGWRYAFFDYSPGETLSMDNFVGFKWFTFLFRNPATRNDIIRVLRNTLVMSGLGLITSWLPMIFAIFLAEITSNKVKRFVQSFTTIPNFISWVMVYSLALAIFSTDGFINKFISNTFGVELAINYLNSDKLIWLKMWAVGTWKGLGWSAIIYVAAISSIDPVMYEAADIDGANRFQKMLYITIPSLLPTYFVLLTLSVASILSNGMEQYLVFENATNTLKITVLDLYVYKLGLDSGNIPLSTVVGMAKSLISITLLFSVNKLSKVVRKESIF
jgi:putative aldouronate transport system permease protein